MEWLRTFKDLLIPTPYYTGDTMQENDAKYPNWLFFFNIRQDETEDEQYY